LEELLTVINKDCQFPVQLIGHSWGAWLTCLFASAYSDYCSSLTLISCPPFDCQYEDLINRTRMDRLSETDFEKFDELAKILNGEVPGDKNRAFAEIGNIFLRVDSYSDTIENPGEICCDYQIYSKVWPQASNLRKSGELIRIVEKIECPITFIHGEQDPHPVSGIREPLDKNNIKYRLICLKDCGHYPWLEPNVKSKFFDLLREILKSDITNVNG
jgi:pimeloyl-ACP methyl ester carboxylesterase